MSQAQTEQWRLLLLQVLPHEPLVVHAVQNARCYRALAVWCWGRQQHWRLLQGAGACDVHRFDSKSFHQRRAMRSSPVRTQISGCNLQLAEIIVLKQSDPEHFRIQQKSIDVESIRSIGRRTSAPGLRRNLCEGILAG